MVESVVQSRAEIVVDSTEKSKIRVLHVDDELDLLKVAKQCLELQGPFHVDSASSVEEALEKMKKEMYDAVVSDYVMPGKDGSDFLKELRDAGNDIPFIMFTGKSKEEIAIRALNLGADGYFSKAGSPVTVYGELAHSICQIVESQKTKEALRTSESYLRAILDSMFTGLIVIDEKTHKIFDANFHALETIAAPRENVIGKTCHRFICPAEEGKCPITDLGQTVDRSERVLLRADGQRIPILKTVTTMIRRGRKYIIESFVDITERKRGEEALKDSERKYREFADSLPEIAFEVDEKGNVTFFNRRAFEILGYSQEDFRSLNIFQFLIPKDQVRVKENIQKILNGEKSRGHEYTLLRKDGSTFPALAFTNRIVSEDGKGGLRGVIIDISEQKNTEERLRESEEKFRNLAEQSPNMIFINQKGRVTYANKEAEDAMGYKKEEFYSPNFNFLDLVAQESKELVQSAFSGHMKGEDVAPYEYRLATKEGKIIDAILTTKLITYEGETAILGTVIDITERKKAELELQESEAKYRMLVEQLPLAIYTISAEDAKITSLNPVFEKITGWKRSEWIGKSFEKLIHPDDLPLALEAFQKAIHGETMPPYELRVLSNSGEYLVGEFTSGPQTEKGKIVGKFGMVRDITERKKAEWAIFESQQKFEGLFMANPEAAVYLGPDFCILSINPRFEDLFGYNLAEIRGRHIDDVIVPDGKIEETKVQDEKASQGYVYYNAVRRRKDGSLVPVFVSAAPITVEDRFLGYVAVYKDISELKNTEKKLEIMNEKLRVTGGLTRHDVRNKLSTVAGNVYLLKKRLADNSDMLDKLKAIESAVQQTVRIFDFAKAYEMLGVEELSYVDVAKTLDEAVSLFPGSINMKVVNECRGLAVLADPLLRQLFYNLIDNSLRYGQKTTRIRVHYEETGQDNLRLVYEDDGVGIPSAEKPKLFKEGYSTGGSTGYGLYLVSKIVEVYGWTIQETGTHGKGVQFTIAIPKVNRDGKESVCVSEV